MTLPDVLPLDELRSRYDRPLVIEHFGIDRVNVVIDIVPVLMKGLGLHVWHRMLQHPDFRHLDQQSLASYINPSVAEFFGNA